MCTSPLHWTELTIQGSRAAVSLGTGQADRERGWGQAFSIPSPISRFFLWEEWRKGRGKIQVLPPFVFLLRMDWKYLCPIDRDSRFQSRSFYTKSQWTLLTAANNDDKTYLFIKNMPSMRTSIRQHFKKYSLDNILSLKRNKTEFFLLRFVNAIHQSEPGR